MPKVRLLLSLVALGAGLLVRPAPSHACSCARPGVEVTPGAGVAAPTNTVVRVSFLVGEVILDESTLVLQPAGKDGKPLKDAKPIEVDTQAITAGKQRTVTLRPRTPLAPETRYEVRAAAAAGEKTGVVGELTTGKGTDDKAPEWAGVGKATYVHTPAICCNCSTGDAYAQIDLIDAEKSSDDTTPPVALVYGVWPAPDEGKKLDPAAAPLTLVRPWSGKLYLGHKSMCSPANYVFPVKGNTKTVTMWIAPIDLAGRVGKPVSVTIDLSVAPPPPPVIKPGAPKPGAPKPPKPGAPKVLPIAPVTKTK